MNLIEFMKEQDAKIQGRVLRIFKDIAEESSPKLLLQLNDRSKKLKHRIGHSQKREAGLKDKLSGVIEAIAKLKDGEVNREDIVVLEGWRDELLKMIDKISYKDLEAKHSEVSAIRIRIRARTSLVNRILMEFDENGNNSE